MSIKYEEYLVVRSWSGQLKAQVVLARPFAIADWEWLQLAAFKVKDRYTDLPWTIFEVTTGCVLSHGETLQEAINFLKENHFVRYSQDEFRVRIERNAKRTVKAGLPRMETAEERSYK